ncbi:MAG: ArsC/Spx/MgsR family protein [Faecalibacterium sp.]
MNIQIFGASKSFDVKKAERWFKERGIKFQMINLKEKEMSRGEFDNVKRALGGYEKMIDHSAKDKNTLALLECLIEYQREDKLFENQQLLKLPIVRNGKQATVGYQPEVWANWN